MKKIVLLSIALSCAFVFAGLSLNKNTKNASAQAEYTISILSDYNADGLFNIEINTNSPTGPDRIYELPFEKNYDEIVCISISVFKQSIPTNYVTFKRTYSINDVEFEFEDDDDPNGCYFKIINVNEMLSEGYSKIEINFELDKFELNTSYKQEPNNIIDANPIGNIINYYRINNLGEKELITPDGSGKYIINYGETLIIEPVEKVTFSNNKSYTFKALYFNIADPGNLVKEDTFVIDAKTKDTDDDRFLDKYIAWEPTSIYFVAVYSNDYSLKLTFNDNYKVDYEIFKVNEDGLNKTSEELFANNTKLVISMRLPNYTKLSHISNLSLADAVDEKDGNLTISFTITRDREFVVYLELVSFKAEDTGSILSGAHITFNKSTFVYGEPVEITSVVENSLNEIKTWEINNISVPNKVGETNKGITRIDKNTVQIDTKVWYEEFNAGGFNKFTNKIITGMKTDILLAIIVPSGVAALAVLILMLIILQNIRTKKKIRALLEEERQVGLKFSGISMADQLREGKSLTVTDEDIKAEMKKRKQKNPEDK